MFTRIVQVLTRIATNEAQLNSPIENISKEKETAVHTMAIKCIVNIVSSLAEYTHLEDLLPAEGEVNGTGAIENGGGAPAIQLTPKSSARVLGSQQDGLTDRGDDDPADSDTRSSVTASNAPTTIAHVVSSFNEKQLFKRHMVNAASKFSVSAKKGVEYLYKEKLVVRDDPAALAQFFIENQDALSKTQIGEYLGAEKDFNIQVLYAYVDELDFSNMQFDLALRKFLKGFRLPGKPRKSIE